MIEGNAKVVKLEGNEMVAEIQNPDKDAIDNVQIQEGQDDVQEVPTQAPDDAENMFLKAMGIHIITKLIFGYLDMQSLKHCVLLHRKLSEQVRVAIAWRRRHLFLNFINDESGQRLEKCFSTLDVYLRSRYFFKNNGAHFSEHLTNSALQRFFNDFGQRIREISLEFPKTASSFSYCAAEPLTEAETISHIKKLVISQALWLQQLNINVYCTIAWKDGSTQVRPLHKEDDEFKSIQSEGAESRRNLNLKKLQILGNISAKIIEMVISVAPRLDEILLQDCDYEYFYSPLNRLYLIKSIIISKENFVTVERILDLNGGELKLVNLSITLGQESQTEPEPRDQVVETRIISCMNTIFARNADTLKSIDWEGVAWFEHLNWPVSFPNVSNLIIGNPIDGSSMSAPVFPADFSLNRVFPVLLEFTMYHGATAEKRICLLRFFECLQLNPVKTVKFVHVPNWEFSRDAKSAVLDIFPNVTNIYFHQ